MDEMASWKARLYARVADRPGHDRRYAVTTEKLAREVGWEAEVPFKEGLAFTVNWYRENSGWVTRVTSGEYQSYYERNYSGREESRG